MGSAEEAAREIDKFVEKFPYASAVMTLNVYSHAVGTMQRDAADRLGAVLFGGR